MAPESVTYAEFETIRNDPEVLVVDVREAEEHARGNLGGMNIPLSEFAARAHELPHDKHLILYCRSGGRSGMAAQALRTAGYERVSNLEGGIIGAGA